MRPHTGLIPLHLAVLLFGIAGLFGKWLLLGPLFIVFGRTSVAAAALLAWQGGRGRLQSPCGQAGWLVISGILLAVHWASFFHAIQVSTVALGLLGFASFPVFVTVLEPLVFRERFRPIDGVTAGIVCAGLVLVVPEFDLAAGGTRGVLWGVVSGFSFAILALLNRARVRVLAPMNLAFYQNAVAALVLLPFVLGDWPALDARDIGLLLILGLACTALAHALFIASLHQLRAQLASLSAALEPVYGIAFAWLLLAEVPDTRTLAGGLLILAGTVWASRVRAGTHPS